MIWISNCLISDEIEAIKELLKEWLKTPLNYNSDFNSSFYNSLFIVAKDTEKNELLGVTQLVITDDPLRGLRWGRIDKVYVKEGHRKQGLAKKMMETVKNQAEAMGCDFIRLDTENWNIPAQRLYKSLGYTQDYSYCLELKK